jgi:hypothetical protein
MMRPVVLFLFLCSLTLPGFTQENRPQVQTQLYQPTLDRLQSLTHAELPEWRFHADIPHPSRGPQPE